jgi:UDP-2-acetamido-3-amino-2,3-dideoxy-glucuronate N-acetyltransferase
MNSYYIHESSYVDDDVVVGQNSKIGHFCHIMAETVIGKECIIGNYATIGPDVRIGDFCVIHNNVSIYEGITLEDRVLCGPSMVFTNTTNPRDSTKIKNQVRPTLIKQGATLGANCIITRGVTIGEYAMIGLGAVVTKDVLDYALMVGNPARRAGWVCACGENLDKEMSCISCGNTYSLNNFLCKRNLYIVNKKK